MLYISKNNKSGNLATQYHALCPPVVVEAVVAECRLVNLRPPVTRGHQGREAVQGGENL